MIPFAKSFHKFLVPVITTAVIAGSLAPSAYAAHFADVGAKYQKAVDFLVSKGISGKADGTFGTHEQIKRVDAAVFVVKALGLDTKSAPASGFTDVPERAAKEVNALKAAGITNGKTKTTFASQDLITRGELAIWIQRGFKLEVGKEELAFRDVADRYKEAVSALVHAEITKGTTAVSFGTHDQAKRGDFALFVYRAHAAKAENNSLAINGVKAINERQIEVTFNQALGVEQAAYIEKAGNRIVAFDLADSAKTAGFVSDVISFSDDRKNAVVILKPTAAPPAEQELVEGKEYTVALVSEYGDYLGFAEVEAQSETAVLLKGLEVPKVEIDEEQKHLIVKFNRRMDETARNAANFEVYDQAVKVNDSFGEAEWVDATTKTAVKLAIRPGALSAEKTYKLKMNHNIEAANGSKLPPSQLVIPFNTPKVTEAQPKVEVARVTGLDEITITFDQELAGFVPVNVHSLTIRRSNGTTVAVNEVRFSEKNIVLKTKEADAFAEGFTYTVSLPSGIAVNNQFHNAVNTAVSDIKAMGVKNTAPTIVYAEFARQASDKEKADLRLTFDRPVAIKETATGDIKIESFGKTYLIAAGTPVEIYGGDETGKTVTIKDVSGAFAIDHSNSAATRFIPETGLTYRVIVEKGIAQSIAPVADEDKKSNQAPLKAIVNGIDVEAPKIEKVTLHSAEKITVQFDEGIIASGLEAADINVKGFIQSVGSRYEAAALTGSSLLAFSVSGDTLTIIPAADTVKFQTGVVENDEAILSISADTIKDANGIENEGKEYIMTTNDVNLYDYAPPIMIGAKVLDTASGTLEVTYSEAVYTKGGNASEAAKQFNISAERNNFGIGSTIAETASEARNIFTITYTAEIFKIRDLLSTKLIYIKNTNDAVQDREQNKQNTGFVTGILNES